MARDYVQLLPEIEALRDQSHRLGRHIEFWAASEQYAIEAEHSIQSWVEEHLTRRSTSKAKTVIWQRRAPIFDQGDLGSCTGNAAAGARGTDSKGRQGDASMNEDVAVDLYSLFTRLDPFPGQYKPDDTGSSGTAACKGMKQRGWISSYRWAFSLAGMLTALKEGPVLLGVAWTTEMDEPDANGRVTYGGTVRGGHEFLCRGFDASENLFVFDNSWSTSFGDNGSFYMTPADVKKMLANNGDVKLPVQI